MTRCYDFALRDNMALRALIALAVIVSCASVSGAAEPWRAVATPPKPGLPRVEVECGYPGGYVSSANTPIRLRARTGVDAFDGYIGFHIRAEGRQTMDVPVIARAVLAPNSDWTFSTWIDVRGTEEGLRRLSSRELFIEWRNHRSETVAFQGIGKPPWSLPRPLRISGEGEVVASDVYLGETSVVLPPTVLSAEPIWYSGFSSVIVSTQTWLTLPQRVREAIFRSAIRVHFFGVPAAMPVMTPVDRALLPIDLLPPPGGPVAAPWPYVGDAAGGPLTWRAKAGARVVGSPSLPYLVVNAVAVFAASEDALRIPIPTFAYPAQGDYLDPLVWRTGFMRPAEVLREYRPLLLVILVVMISIAGWLAMLRAGRTLIVAASALVLLSLLVIGVREWIRPREGLHVYSSLTLAAPGVVDIRTARRDYGVAPRAVPEADLAGYAGRVTRRISWHSGELRTSDTPPGLGTLLGGQWRSSLRHSIRRELATPASIRTVSYTADEYVVDFASDRPVNYVAAQWTWKGTRREGVVRVGSISRGRAVVRDRREVWPSIWWWTWMAQEVPASATPEDSMTGASRVVLFNVKRDATTVIRSIDSSTAVTAPPYRIAADLHQDRGRTRSVAMVLPGPTPERARVRLILSQISPNSLRQIDAITLEGPAGSAAFDRSTMKTGRGLAEIRAEELRRIAPVGGVVKLIIDPGTSAAELSRTRATLLVLEEKQ